MKRSNGKRLVILLLVLILITASIVWVVNAADRSNPQTATNVPPCRSSQIAVRIGPNLPRSSKYPLAIQLIPLTFKNEGKSCHLQMGGPVVEAIVGRAPLGSTPTANLSFPAIMSQSFGVVEIEHGRQAEALFEVWKVPSSIGGRLRSCILKTASRLSIGGYALPQGQQEVFIRLMPKVCFEAGGATPKVNTQVIWLKP